ncbi:MAG: prenyltransferase/squalene oxidase repeat-containing protein, partial [Planctomycetota bacterium]
NASSRGQNSRRKPGRTNRRRARDVRAGPGRSSRRRVGVPAPQGRGKANGSGNGSSAASDDGGRAGQSGTADRQPDGAAGTGSSPPTGSQVDPQHPKPNDQDLEFERTPVPDAAAQQQIEKLIRSGDLQEDFEAADAPQGRLALARKLLAEGTKPQDDVTSAYVLLRLARDEATGLGEAGTALAAVDEIGQRYQIDVLVEKVKTLEAASKATSTPAHGRTLLEKTLGVMDEAAAAEDFQAADRLLRIARSTAPRVREGVLARGELSKLVKTRAAKIDRLKENRQPGQPAPTGSGEVFDPRVLPVFGSSDASEAAVDRALKWLAEHQQADGSWSFDHTGPPCKKRCRNPGTLAAAPNAATALALLPFLAAGDGPRQGEFRENVADGLNFLKSRLNPLGPTVATLYEPRAGQMRPHALGTIALCEASAVSPDRQTRKAAQSAVNFIVASQNADGGWPPQPQLPAQQAGPSSIDPTGWNLAALRTAQWAGLQVPRKTLKQARAYLKGMRTEDKIGYRPDENSAGRDDTATAVAVLCQMYLGWPHEENELVDYVATLGKPGPSTAGQFYLNYYNSQVMRHHGGAAWDAWNAALRDQLVASQASDGHTAGSWHVRGFHWSNRQGGRLFCTALAALMLEVSYRHPPLYH